jgi:type II secretory pathway pseudopilin PulG
MKRYLLIFFLVLLIILLAISSTVAVVFYFQANTNSGKIDQLTQENQVLKNQIQTLENGNNSVVPTNPGTPTPTADPCKSFSDGLIEVDGPCKNSLVVSPVTVKGIVGGLFEGAMTIQILDDSGIELKLQPVTVPNTSDVPTDFSFKVSFPATTAATGKIRVFTQSAKDGSEEHAVVVPVRFK